MTADMRADAIAAAALIWQSLSPAEKTDLHHEARGEDAEQSDTTKLQLIELEQRLEELRAEIADDAETQGVRIRTKDCQLTESDLVLAERLWEQVSTTKINEMDAKSKQPPPPVDPHREAFLAKLPCIDYHDTRPRAPWVQGIALNWRENFPNSAIAIADGPSAGIYPIAYATITSRRSHF